MAALLKVLTTIRNNWKKSTVAALILAYGSNYAKEKYTISQVMRVYCEEAKKYGEEPIPVFSKPKHVTVILNPAARDGKGKKLYEKYAAPLLNLSGMKVSVIQTEHEGQAKDLMNIMANTDAVIVAGGNGTLHEAITGFLRRNDEPSVLQKIPLGVAPIGKTNTVARALFWKPNMLEEQLVAEATMAVIRSDVKQVDVMRVHGSKGQPVYSLIGLECGVFRDVDSQINKYWYFGPLKRRVAYILKKSGSPILSANFSYVLPCSGCSHCYKPTVLKPASAQNKRWWSSFLPKSPVVKREVFGDSPVRDFSKIVNEKCGIWYTRHFQFSNLAINLGNFKDFEGMETPALKVAIHPFDLLQRQIILEGWKLPEERKHSKFAECIDAKEVTLKIPLPEGEERWYSIDDEHYEVQDITVTVMPSQLSIFVKT